MGYRKWNAEDFGDDDGYDAMKDAYHEGWGRPYNETSRREVEEEMEDRRHNR